MSGAPDRPLKILHVLRAPVGGLFRHVVDLVRGQVERGHAVGIVADSSTGGARANETFDDLMPRLSLGLTRLPVTRQLAFGDLAACLHVARRVGDSGVDVVHGHGAKGGAYARLTTTRGPIRAYTPHGGSLNYHPGTPLGVFYLSLERMLMKRTELFLFESAYAREVFRTKVGTPFGCVRVIHNGVTASEFEPIAPKPDAADLVFIGELRPVKGVDVLLDALDILRRAGHLLTATIVGTGPDEAALIARAKSLALGGAVRFAGSARPREAFALGRLLVIPSLTESLPYVVLEAAAAAMPMLTTSVGGIPEIFGPQRARLLPAGNAQALAAAISAAFADPDRERGAAQALQQRVRTAFSADVMTEQVLAAYREALGSRAQAA